MDITNRVTFQVAGQPYMAQAGPNEFVYIAQGRESGLAESDLGRFCTGLLNVACAPYHAALDWHEFAWTLSADGLADMITAAGIIQDAVAAFYESAEEPEPETEPRLHNVQQMEFGQ